MIISTMKNYFLIFIFFISTAIAENTPDTLIFNIGDAKYNLTPRTNNSFTYGEKLKFKVYYGIINGGTAELEIADKPKIINGRNSFHIKIYGKSTGIVDVMFRVKDQFESYLDEEYLVPWKATKNVKEGNYKSIDLILFDQLNGIAHSNEKGKIEIAEYTQDVASCLYFARSTDMSNARPGDVFPVNFYLDGKNYGLRFKYIGTENIKTDLGTFRTLKIKPQLLEGRVFKDSEALTLWVTDDENKIPIRAESAIFVGAVKMDLVEYSGLKNPMNAKLR